MQTAVFFSCGVAIVKIFDPLDHVDQDWRGALFTRITCNYAHNKPLC